VTFTPESAAHAASAHTMHTHSIIRPLHKLYTNEQTGERTDDNYECAVLKWIDGSAVSYTLHTHTHTHTHTLKLIAYSFRSVASSLSAHRINVFLGLTNRVRERKNFCSVIVCVVSVAYQRELDVATFSRLNLFHYDTNVC
jgi:hypothetical protein